MTTTPAADPELGTVTVEQQDRGSPVRFCVPRHNFVTAPMHKDLYKLTAAVDDDGSIGARSF